MRIQQAWRDQTNQRHDFLVYDNQSSWPYWGGVYLFCHQTSTGWKTHYIGETDNFSKKLSDDHEQWLYAQAMGATHVHILLESSHLDRQYIARQLIAKLNPSCNAELILHSIQGQIWEKHIESVA